MRRWPTWVEIDLAGIRHNVRQIRNRIGPDVRLMLVVKGDGYGHGLCRVAGAAAEAGAEKFGVASVDEAVLLREHGFTQPILIVGLSLEDAIGDIVRHDVMATVCRADWAEKLSAEAARQGKTAAVNVKVNTGMNRIGIEPEEAVAFVKKMQSYPNLYVEGIFTHLATSYTEKAFAAEQFAAFTAVLDALDEAGIVIPYRHCANTGAVLNGPHMYLNQVRPGIMATTPFAAIDPRDAMDLRECFRFKSKVVFARNIRAGDSVGYDRLYTAEADGAIAVVSAGWGDGIPRELTNKGYVLIHGVRCPIRGRVMCDQVLADVTAVPGTVEPGDEVVIIGAQGNESISCWEWGRLLGGVSSPVTLRCNGSARVARKYLS